jgi:hypothetical protein
MKCPENKNGYHRMQFGAHILEDQRVRFHLRAPGACHGDISIKKYPSKYDTNASGK